MKDRPNTLQLAAALFSSKEKLQTIYGLPFEIGLEQRALIALTLLRLAAGEAVSYFLGAAGTGKTTTLAVLLQVLVDCGVTYTVSAPTHKAAARAKESIGQDVKTVHSIIYKGAEEILEKDENGEVKEFASELDFNKRDAGSASVGKVLIIDESSMIGSEVASDLWAALPKGTQVIAVGDPHQLPPVGDKPGFDFSQAEMELTEVFRQEDGSPVLKAATAIREKRVGFTFSELTPYKEGVAILKKAGVQNRWCDPNNAGVLVAAMLKRTDGNAVAICGTHRTRVNMNNSIRSHLGLADRKAGPQVGEKLVARSSAGGMKNAETCVVLEVKVQDFGGAFGSGWIMKVKTEAGYEKEVAVLRHTWMNTHPVSGNPNNPDKCGLIPHTVKAQMGSFIEGDMKKFGKLIAAKVEKRSDAWKVKKGEDAPKWLVQKWTAEEAKNAGAWSLYLDAHLAALDSGYAITCHSSQGSQWKEIAIVADMVDFMADGDVDNVYRWSYTALTRAEESAIIINKLPGKWK